MGVTSRIDVSPSCDPTSSSRDKTAALTSQAHRSDVVCEGDSATQTQQSDVVVFGFCVILGVIDDLCNTSGDLIGIVALLSLSPQVHHQVTRIREAVFHTRRKKKDSYLLFTVGLLLYTKTWMRHEDLSKQCAAVMTQRLLMRDPPQKWLPEERRCKLTCHGHAPDAALCPPTIRLFKVARPHTEKREIRVTMVL